MADAKPSTSILNTPVANKNLVAHRIAQVAAAKRAGKFTFQVGRADRAINLAMGVAMLYLVGSCGAGIHQLANGYGKKEGF